MRFEDYVNECKNIYNKIKNDLHIIIVANKYSSNDNDYTINETMDFVLKLCNENDISTSFYTDEKDFINFLQNDLHKVSKKNIFVYNRMANGQWGERRVLIPSLCKHYNIPYFGHNSYVMGILCNKSHYTSILKEFNISVPTSWVYDNKYGWTSQEPQYGQKVIIKPIYENNSTSITQESIIIYNQDNKSIIHELSLKFNQPILAQKFISGYEISVPVFSYKNQTIIPQVIGSKLNGNKKYGNNIVSESYNYARRYEDINDKYFDFNDINEYTSKNIINDCIKISKVIGIESISRFDLRVDESFQYYFNDLGSIPGFLPKSSFEYVFIKHNFNYNDFLICSIVSDYIKYYSI